MAPSTGRRGVLEVPPLPARGERVGVRGPVVARAVAAYRPAPHPDLLPVNGEKGRSASLYG